MGRTKKAAKISYRSYFVVLGIVVLLSVILTAHNKPMRGETTLLTYIEETDSGGSAKVHLLVEPGSGRIFIDSFPMSKLDTQSSTRHANKIACDFLDIDCSKYDFYYTIRAESAIVGGPSAGGAIAVLTASVLDGQEINSKVGMTGTINSGGVIGPVAGITEKIDGAIEAELTTIIVPSIVNPSNDTNESVTPAIKVLQVGNLAEALEVFTGKSYVVELPPPTKSAEYSDRMRDVASLICDRMEELTLELEDRGEEFNDTGNFSARLLVLPLGRDYSRASLCFSANIALASQLRNSESVEERIARYERLQRAADRLDEKLDGIDVKTISDLEVYAIVKERLIEARQALAEVDEEDPSPYVVGFVEERLVSATSWSRFFGMSSKKVLLDDKYLRNACLERITEAEERLSYLRLYSETLTSNAESTLDEAYRYEEDEPAICLFIASKAKAEANVVAGALSLKEEAAPVLLEEKLRIAERVVAGKQKEGFFPILGYSYYEYSTDLGASYVYSALNFAEYAIELSNVDMYFPEAESNGFPKGFWNAMVFFTYGALFGLGIAGLLLFRPHGKN